MVIMNLFKLLRVHAKYRCCIFFAGFWVGFQTKGQFEGHRPDFSMFTRASSLDGSTDNVSPKTMPSWRNDEPFDLTPNDGHYMFGYYDKQQVDETDRRVLVGKIPFYDKEPDTLDTMQIGWTSFDRRFHHIANTTAWNLQQGSMMEWISPTSIVFNIREGTTNSFAAQVYCTETGDFVRWRPLQKFNRAVYAWSHIDKKFASISFSRLHNLRRGYGYTVKLGEIEKCPRDDGIWIVDAASGKEVLLLSYSQAREFLLEAGSVDVFTGLNHFDEVPVGSDYYWWVNHIMFSTDGRRLSFIVRASKEIHGHSYQFSTLMMADMEKKDFWRVPLLRGSHPFHHQTLLNCEDKGSFDISFKSYVTQLPWQRGVDGHCSKHPSKDIYLTDTYPRPSKDLIVVSDIDHRKKSLGTFMPGNEGPVFTRCDLHPRWSRQGDFVLFDSTHLGKKRAVYALPSSVPERRHKNSKNCKTIFVDMGANIGMHARFLFEPNLYPASGKQALKEMYQLFESHFGSPSSRSLPTNSSGICVFGFEANAKQQKRLEQISRYFGDKGMVVQYQCPKAVWVNETKLLFERKDGIGYGTASRLVDSKSGGQDVVIVETIDIAKFITGIYEEFKPDIIFGKMDIEGAEYTVLPHLEKSGLLCSDNPFAFRAITLEYHSRFTGHSLAWKVPESYPCTKKSDLILLDSEDYVRDGRDIPLLL